MEQPRRARLAIRTVLVTYRAALRNSTNQAEVHQRAQRLLEREAIRMEPKADDDLRRLLDDARHEIGGRVPTGSMRTDR